MRTMFEIQTSDIITSPQLPEPAKVVTDAQFDGTHWHVMAVGIESNQFYQRSFLPDEVRVRRITFAADGERFRLAALAERIRAAAQYDPQFAIGISQIDPLPHQIEAVYRSMLQIPSDGQLRYSLEPQPAGAAYGAHPPLRTKVQRAYLQPGSRRYPRGQRP
jgi:hypothetical protein